MTGVWCYGRPADTWLFLYPRVVVFRATSRLEVYRRDGSAEMVREI
jgi:hypothetical protein